MEIVVDPAIQAKFDANLAEYQDRSARVSETLKSEQQEIAERTKAADEKFATERDELLSKVKKDFQEPKDGEQPQRVVGWNPVEGDGGRDENVMAFNTEQEEAEYQRPVVRRPAPKPRRDEPDEDDYSDQSWLRG